MAETGGKLMSNFGWADAVQDARSVAAAGGAVVRAIHGGPAALDDAVDRLELLAVRTVGQPVRGFDAAGAQVDDEDLVAVALTQLGIGNTLLSAEAAIESASQTKGLESAVATLERTADALDAQDAAPDLVHGFDTRPGGAERGVVDAALAALGEMAEATAEVVSGTLDRAMKPITSRIPATLQGLATDLDLDLPGRLARWGLRAVRRGLDLLLELVDLDAIERARARLDDMLARLGRGEDVLVLSGWAIGADAVRAQLDKPDRPLAGGAELVDELARLTERFVRLCHLLRRVAVLVAGLAATLALLHVTLPHAATVTAVGMVLVLASTVVIGRDYTGATDLPGRVRGVRVLLGRCGDANA